MGLVDVRRAVRGEQGPGDVDPVAVAAGDVVVDGDQLLVEQDGSGAGDVVVLGHRAAGEVPGRPTGSGRAEDVESARLIRVLRDAGAPLEYLARKVGVAAAVPGHRGV